MAHSHFLPLAGSLVHRAAWRAEILTAAQAGRAREEMEALALAPETAGVAAAVRNRRAIL